MASLTNLEGGCFVVDQSSLELSDRETISWAQVIGNGDGAERLSLFYMEARQGTSPAINAGDGDCVLYLQQGECTVNIGGSLFDAMAGTGIHIRPGEQFSVINDSGEPARLLLSICPRVSELSFLGEVGVNFDSNYPERTASVKDARLNASGDRFYQLLVGPSIGSTKVTQFIGRVPMSKAPEHFHLYEEAICILSGHGKMWAGNSSAPVQPGSMIFLPREQPHCMECLDESGLVLMGVFYPAGSPAINYET